jgi:hypothetical protein
MRGRDRVGTKANWVCLPLTQGELAGVVVRAVRPSLGALLSYSSPGRASESGNLQSAYSPTPYPRPKKTGRNSSKRNQGKRSPQVRSPDR